jgi:hypothetical protein
MTTAAKKTTAKKKQAIAKISAEETRIEMAKQAYLLRQEGRSWAQVAQVLDSEPNYVRHLVSDALREAAAMIDDTLKQELLSLEVGRLDTLQQAYWTDAITGDIKAAEYVLKVIQSRVRTLGLETNVQTEKVTNNTIVVSGTPEEYINALRRVSELPAISYEEM